MKLNKIHITNFRCFKEYHVEFAPGVTVLFGKNGAGKTTLIHAIHKALSFIMYSDIVRKKEKGAKKSKIVEVKTITNGNPYLHIESYAKDDFNNTNDPLIEISAEATLPIKEEDGYVIDHEYYMSWAMSAFSNNAKIRTSAFNKAFNAFYNWHKETEKLPLLAYYSDGFPHEEDTKKQSVKKKIAELRNFGYFDWNEKEACTKEWIERLENDIKERYRIQRRLEKYANEIDPERIPTQDSIKTEQDNLQKFDEEIKAIEECFFRFSNCLENDQYKIVSLDIDTDEDKKEKLCLKSSHGNSIIFKKLPAGYHRLFSIVLDIALRSYILSKSVDAKGIIIIDEIDLHLHPELERLVLPAFMSTFPNLQIILSTHSYAVLAGLETEGQPNVILKMETNQTEPYVHHDIYGLDYNTGIEDVMGVKSKNDVLDYYITLCAFSRLEGELNKANEIKRSIIEKYSKNEEELEKLIASKQKDLE